MVFEPCPRQMAAKGLRQPKRLPPTGRHGGGRAARPDAQLLEARVGRGLPARLNWKVWDDQGSSRVDCDRSRTSRLNTLAGVGFLSYDPTRGRSPPFLCRASSDRSGTRIPADTQDDRPAPCGSS